MLQLRVTVVPCRTDIDSGSSVNAMGVACSVYGKAVCASWRKEDIDISMCSNSISIIILLHIVRKVVSGNSEKANNHIQSILLNSA